MKHFKFYTKEDILSATNIRRFETKLGERVLCMQGNTGWHEALQGSKAKFVVLGIPEDIGVKANYGYGGADTAWLPFLAAFLNIQSNDFLTGDDILVLGHFDFSQMKSLVESKALGEEELVDAYRHAVNEIDEQVENLLKVIASCNKVPVIIGGGHNNAYPIIKGVAKGLHKAGLTGGTRINVINLDAHSDFRSTEGRHSGNAFRYASEDGYLGKYAVIGIHENYLPQNVLVDIQNLPFIDYTSYEDIFLHERKNFIQAIAGATGFTGDIYTGIELDLDCIENVLSSAVTPAGITPLHARQFVTFVARDSKPAYLHICEGAALLADGRRSESIGKLISYLVSDFIKACISSSQP